MSTPPKPSYPGVGTIVDLLELRAEREPDRTALIFLRDGETDEEPLTYGELARHARSIAVRLRERAAPGDRILLLYPPGLDFVKGIFGCLYAGMVAVPAYPPDPTRLDRSLPRLRAIAGDAQADVVLSTGALVDARELLFGDAEGLRGVSWLASDRVDPAEERAWTGATARADDLAVLQYTSGSTATPKGVMVPHRNVLSSIELRYDISRPLPDDRAVIWLPQFHDFGLFEGTFFPIFADELPRVLMSPVDFLQKPMRWLRAMTRYRAVASAGPNFAFDLCVRRARPEDLEALDLSCWDTAVIAAEPIRRATLERFAKTFAPCGFRRSAFYPCYGLAEATLVVSNRPRHAGDRLLRLDRRALGRRVVSEADAGDAGAVDVASCGHPVPGVDVRVVDPDSGAELDAGRVGEIWVKSPTRCRGYWNRPEETRRCFEARTADGEGPYLRTGDAGFVDDGEIFLTGRLKDLIIIAGRNVYPQDIEATVDAAHPALRPGCGAAVGIEVDGSEQLAVVHEVRAGSEEQVDEIVSAVRRAVSERHRETVHTVALLQPGTVPKTSSGKIQRHACREGLEGLTLACLAVSRFGHVPEAAVA